MKYSRKRKKPLKLKLWVKIALILIGVAVITTIVILCNQKPIENYEKQTFYPKKYSEIVTKYAKEYSVEEHLIYAVIKTESGFDPEAISEDNARGLMQVTPETFDWIGGKIGITGQYQHEDLHKPEVGIQYGVYLLSYLIDEFDDYKNVLAAYHAGRGAVNKWLKDTQYSANGKVLDSTPYSSTNHYINKVMNNLEKYNHFYEIN